MMSCAPTRDLSCSADRSEPLAPLYIRFAQLNLTTPDSLLPG